MADRLADQLGQLWSAEAKQRDLNRPPLAVSWRPADPALVQPWAHLQRLVADGAGWTPRAYPAADPHELAGAGRDLIKVLDRVPTGRLVVLGEPGSGKTMLLIGLVLDLLARRGPGEPVPLLVPVASWNPGRDDLYGWLETQIIREHPWLAGTSAAGISRARALLAAGLILPVLDGLDEIHSGGRDQALTSVNDTLRDGAGLVLSCRVTAFRHAIRPGPLRQPVCRGHPPGPLGPRRCRCLPDRYRWCRWRGPVGAGPRRAGRHTGPAGRPGAVHPADGQPRPHHLQPPARRIHPWPARPGRAV
ncbi:NACHT domain-containing protein [Candidatus Protofrankia californiensis]|uniref:NACHT domain-containing protein n=1 Tax=Candidatus Protofrankia californiensis TaxID=1839754 RepID=UPI001041013A|nr:NACHT domain-containing protein [Candidatus Protofrankia californiensis]